MERDIVEERDAGFSMGIFGAGVGRAPGELPEQGRQKR
jgi:hypothetical protein